MSERASIANGNDYRSCSLRSLAPRFREVFCAVPSRQRYPRIRRQPVSAYRDRSRLFAARDKGNPGGMIRKLRGVNEPLSIA